MRAECKRKLHRSRLDGESPNKVKARGAEEQKHQASKYRGFDSSDETEEFLPAEREPPPALIRRAASRK